MCFPLGDRFADPLRKASPDPHDVKVESVMTTNVLTLTPRDGVIAAASLMRRERVGAVPIVEGQRLVGILARSDLLDALIALGSLAEAKTASR